MVLSPLILPTSSPTVCTNSLSTSASLRYKYIHPLVITLTKYNFFLGIAVFVQVQFVF